MMPAIDFDIDESARAGALDVTRSFIVKAPAGSGKTQLLTLRLLALLAKVEEPGEILAITFTKAATAEMRGRVLSALLRADAGTQMDEPESTLARAALEHAKKRGWSLLEQPQLLNIQTIDSLCLQIAHGAPLLSRLGGQLQPTEDAKALYQLAASRTLEKLAVDSSALSNALKHLLVLRDVNLGDCETLIANMLENRDLWLGEFANARSLNEEDWAKLRERLEEPFRREHTRALRNVKGLLDGARGRQLLALAAYACSNNPTVQIHDLGSIASFEDLTHIDHYRCILEFVLTKQRDWRKKPDARLGFPTEKQGGSAHHKAAFEALLLELTTIDGLREALCAVDGLPAERFTDEQWQTILSIFTVLLHAAAELRVVFAEKSTIDFVELGLTAEFALKDTEHQRLFSGTIRHLLVDEFQDTSRRQYELLKKIASAWEPDERRTCFLVGDPMQSVYLFRHADLALFNEVLKNGISSATHPVSFSELTLRRNFRSDAGIVNPLNAMFAEMSVQNHTKAREKSQFTPAVANSDTPDENAVHVRAQFTDDRTNADLQEAAWAIEAIRPHLPAIERARKNGDEYRVGVLVRARKHVTRIAAALRDAGIGYRAIELETLEECQEIRDLLSLLRALSIESRGFPFCARRGAGCPSATCTCSAETTILLC
jgi:ATP-dependent helicase/nuclease subunit A